MNGGDHFFNGLIDSERCIIRARCRFLTSGHDRCRPAYVRFNRDDVSLCDVDWVNALGELEHIAPIMIVII